MTNIAGPYTQEDFRTMQMLKASIPYMKKKNAVMYKDTIDLETTLLKNRLQRKLVQAA